MNSFEAEEVKEGGGEIAIVGMSLRFPGAKNVAEFWQNLRDGVESVSFFSEQELAAAGVSAEILRAPNYVRASATLGDVESFDASFFGFYPREAELMDPQHRLFLECAWEALEDAGYNPDIYQGMIGVYAGAGINSYLMNNLLSNEEAVRTLDPYQLIIQNDKDFLASRVSYKFNLKGPSVVVQSACSTSLVAVHFACQSLLSYQCDMALSGGVTIRVPEQRGYLYEEGGVASPDGHCRAFDARARGIVGGNGVGIVVLKRLGDAIADGDSIHAIIKGSAINNDGSMKVGFTAPSVEGQSAVIAMAQAVAQVEADSIGYVETHGTGTVLGDPIEISALTEAFRSSTSRKNFCAVGSVKTNVGHLDTAAGVAGLIKTVLALKHKMIPPSLNFEHPNPNINFANSPFYVNARLSPWDVSGTTRRAGVSSFGMGGTNAHLILEEAPGKESASHPDRAQLLVLSAKTSMALEKITANLIAYLKQHPDASLADVAWTLQVGRKAFKHRRAVVCRTVEEAARLLEEATAGQVFTASELQSHPSIIFLFPGQGAQEVQMGAELYRVEALFREQVDYCAEFLRPLLGCDLRDVIYPDGADTEEATRRLNQTALTQPALFVVEYATARLWMEWGIRPQAMIGHSIGEYVAACVAGVLSLKDALRLVARRGRLMQELPAGLMLAVTLSQGELQPFLPEEISLAAVNGPAQCVVSGESDAIRKLERRLTEAGVAHRRLQTSHAFHSTMMEPILETFTAEVKRLSLHPSSIPYLSNLSGTWVTEEDATDPHYWPNHLRRTVRFAENVAELARMPDAIWLEVGPGQTLGQLVRKQPGVESPRVLSSMSLGRGSDAEESRALRTLGRLWLAGSECHWPALHAGTEPGRISLPTYPFERQRYWIAPATKSSTEGKTTHAAPRKLEASEWLYAPLWKQSLPLLALSHAALVERTQRWLVFDDGHPVAAALTERLKQSGHDVLTVTRGAEFIPASEHSYSLNPSRRADYDLLLSELQARRKWPDIILHQWSAGADEATEGGPEAFAKAQETGFYSLLYLAQALGKQHSMQPLQVCVVTEDAQGVTGLEQLRPERATILGLCKVIPQEYSHITCRSIDLHSPEALDRGRAGLAGRLIAEILNGASERTVAYRGGHRWVQSFERLPLEAQTAPRPGLRQGGVYLITGGLGRIGLLLARHLAQSVQAKLVLVGRTKLPAREDWETWVATHDEQDASCQKIRDVQALEILGSEVLIVSADVSAQAEMRALLSQLDERFGALHGVIHAAGLIGPEWLKEVQQTERRDCEAHFRPKAYGLISLAGSLSGRELDFCLLMSSVSSILGGLAFAAYASANSYMDAFAQRRNMDGGSPWLSVNWDGWRSGEGSPQMIAGVNQQASLSLTAQEGGESFQRLLPFVGEVSQLVVSTSDLSARINQWIKLERPAGLARTTGSGVAGSPVLTTEEVSQGSAGEMSASEGRYPRPPLQTIFVAPRDEAEKAVARIWTQALGIGEIGVDDNFFELGGDSLLATQVIAQLRASFQVELSVQNFFNNPTVASLAATLTSLSEERESDDGAELLRMLEQLSEEETEVELNRRTRTAVEESA
jgi:acyl transferase domain-containing protein/acyl carrier protein